MSKTVTTIIKWAVCIILPIIIMNIPLTKVERVMEPVTETVVNTYKDAATGKEFKVEEKVATGETREVAKPKRSDFTAPVRNYLALSLFLIALIATGVLPVPAIGLLMPIAYIILLGLMRNPANPKAPLVPPPALIGQAFGAWVAPAGIVWMVMASFMIAFAMEKTGLAKRIALRCVLALGGSYVGIMVGMVVAGGIVSLVITDISAKAVLFSTLAFSICKALKLELGSKEASGIGLSAMVAFLDPAMLFKHGSANILVPLSIAEQTKGFVSPSWGEYFKHMFVPQFIFVLVLVIVLIIYFRPSKEVKASIASGIETLRGELKVMGGMKSGEIKLAFISVLLVASIILQANKLIPIDLPWLFVIAGILTMVPGIKIIEVPELGKCNFPFTIFLAACMSMGMVAGLYGVGPFLADLFLPLVEGARDPITGMANPSNVRVFGGIFVMAAIINIVLTPLAAYSAFTGAVVGIAQTVNVNPLSIVYAWAMSFELIIHPYQFIPVLILFGYGMISMKQMIKFNVTKFIWGFICTITVYLGWWTMMGIVNMPK